MTDDPGVGFDFDDCIAHLERVEDQDEEGYSAYSYKEWSFWINRTNFHCRYLLER